MWQSPLQTVPPSHWVLEPSAPPKVCPHPQPYPVVTWGDGKLPRVLLEAPSLEPNRSGVTWDSRGTVMDKATPGFTRVTLTPCSLETIKLFLINSGVRDGKADQFLFMPLLARRRPLRSSILTAVFLSPGCTLGSPGL